MRRALIVIGVCALASAALAAEVYKWTDAEGKVHFSDSPPPGVTDAVKTSIISAPTNPEHLQLLEDTADLKSKQDATADEIRANREKAAADDQAAKQKYCDDMKAYYEDMQHSRKFSVQDKDGKETWLSGEDADKKKQATKAKMDEACAAAAK